MRVAIVNDLRIATEALRRVVASSPQHQMVWTAADGAEAVRKCAADRPDVILMDLIMPVMDGVEATRQIMANSPCAILVVTATVEGNFTKVYEAMGHGALDAVNTPVLGIGGKVEGGAAMLAKIATVGKMLGAIARKVSPAAIPPPPAPPAGAPTGLPPSTVRFPLTVPLVAIGASTGGPQAVGEILASLGGSFPGSLVVAQHITADFAPGLAEWLGKRSGLDVKIATPGEAPQRGRVLLSGTNDHLVMRLDRTFGYSADPLENPYRPSVDALFASLADHWRQRSIAVLLTGMGRDGAQGLLRLRQAGWLTIAQDARTSVVYGMPQAAAELGAAQHILPIAEIGPAIAAHMKCK